MNMNQAIQRYAYLMTGVEREASHGRQPPPKILNEMNKIYARAQATLTPQEQSQALRAVDTMKAQYHHQADTQGAMRDANNQGYATDKLAKEITGLNAGQLQHALRGEPVPHKGKNAVDLKKLDRQLEGMSKQMGIPTTRKKIEKVSDAYFEAKAERGHDYARQKLRKNFGSKAVEAENLIEAYAKSEMDLLAGLQERRGTDEDYLVKTDDTTQRNAQVADAWARSADATTLAGMTQGIDPAYLEDEGSQGDVARAFQAHESNDTKHERENYRPEQYDISEEEYKNANAQ